MKLIRNLPNPNVVHIVLVYKRDDLADGVRALAVFSWILDQYLLAVLFEQLDPHFQALIRHNLASSRTTYKVSQSFFHTVIRHGHVPYESCTILQAPGVIQIRFLSVALTSLCDQTTEFQPAWLGGKLSQVCQFQLSTDATHRAQWSEFSQLV